ncbi:MAG: VanZ family protein [Gammaproteobacteria bacterium]|nr:VanZ family protein [Gammaproteobacteria bacterium]MDH3448010.1 VanZ family protein [Gammaproteobacteria bacterium]
MGDTDNRASMRSRLRLYPLWYGLGALMLLLVAVLSLVPVPEEIGVDDKLAHTVTYFILAGWFSLLASHREALGWTFAGLLAYGMAIELLQGMTAYRFAEWGDVVANGTGIAAGMLLYLTPLPRVLRLVDRNLARILQE